MGNTVLPVFLCDFVRAFPKIELDIELTDRRVDLVKEGFDCAHGTSVKASSVSLPRPPT